MSKTVPVFDSLLGSLSPEEAALKRNLHYNHVENAYAGRIFVVHKEGKVLDTLQVLDFDTCDETGASSELRSLKTGATTILGYRPTQLFDYELMAWIPTNTRLGHNNVPDPDTSTKVGISFLICLASPEKGDTSKICCDTLHSFMQKMD